MAMILYIEDNPDSRLLIRRVLEAKNFVMLEAGCASEALEILGKFPIDLILMDINMPDVDGYTLTAQLKTRPELRQVPIIALTANALQGDRERTIAAGCDGYIQKPIDVDTFPDQIHRYLRRHAAQKRSDSERGQRA